MKKHLLFCLLLSYTLSICAQELELSVLDTLGSEDINSLNMVQKITYPTDSIKIHFTDGSASAYHILSLQNIVHQEMIVTDEVSISSDQTFDIYPNPFVDEIQVSYFSETASLALIQIVDLNGRVVKQETFKIDTGKTSLTMQIPHIKRGTYICCLSTTNGTQTQLILKR